MVLLVLSWQPDPSPAQMLCEVTSRAMAYEHRSVLGQFVISGGKEAIHAVLVMFAKGRGSIRSRINRRTQ